MADLEDESAQTAQELENREMPWCQVDEEVALLLVGPGSVITCRMVQLGLGGCRLLMPRRIANSLPATVEANFRINGLAFRLSGTATWTDGGGAAEMHFSPISSRRRDELMEVLCEVEAAHAAKSSRETSPTASQRPFLVPRPRIENTDAAQLAVPDDGELQSSGKKAERRTDPRSGVETTATIHLVKIGSKLAGQVLDLSLGGCRIRTDERFPVGIYTRVETEFRLQGICFLLAGVVQTIHDRHQVGIRFLDVSERKREQVAELIEEIETMRGTAATNQDL